MINTTFHSAYSAEEMINEVRAAFQKNLRNLDWMDEETRKLADEKADAISDMIGFPDYILNPAELDEKYKDLIIDPDKYFENNIKYEQRNDNRTESENHTAMLFQGQHVQSKVQFGKIGPTSE